MPSKYRVIRSAATIGLCAAAAGCNPFDATACTTSLEPAVSVRVRDAATGEWAAAGARLVVRAGGYADSVERPTTQPGSADEPLSAAWERPGVYTVTVRKAGYQDWTRSGVSVSRDECHVRTARIVADIVRPPQGSE